MSFENPGFPKKQQPIPSADQHVAVCYAIIDLGKQKEQFENKPASWVNKCQFCWELPNLPKVVFDEAKGAQPMAIFNEYTVAAGDRAKLPKMLCAWGRIPPADLTAISNDLMKMFVGQACMIQVEHNASKKDKDSETGQPIMYANVGQKGLSVLPFATNLGLVKPTGTINPPIFFSLDEFSWEKYDRLPKGIQKKISECQEWAQIVAKYPKAAATPSTTTAPANFVQSAAPVAQANTLESSPGVATPKPGSPSF